MSVEEKTYVVAVVGMCGSGKSVFAQHFIDANWPCVYFGGLTMEILESRNLTKTQDNEKEVRESLRREHGMDAYAKLLYPRINSLSETQNVVLDGLYSWAEYKFLKEKLGNKLKVIAVITNRDLRYQRLERRKIRPLTPEQANERDYHEVENLDKGGPISIADYYIDNNGTLQDLSNCFQVFMNWLNEQ